MSTPFPPNSKRKGLSIYAPPRVRDRAFSQDVAGIEDPAEAQDPAEGADTSAQTEPAQADPTMTEWDQTPVPEETSPANEAGGAKDALDWLDDAIREVLDLKLASDSNEEPDPSASTPSAPSIAPMHDDSETWPATGTRTQGRVEPRNARPRPPRLETETVPPPPPPMRQRSGLGQVLRIFLVIVFAAFVAYGVTLLYPSGPGAPQPKEPSHRVAEAAPQQLAPEPASAPTPPQLIVEDQQAFANEPVSLAVNVEHAATNESLLFDGLPQGTMLSAGAAVSPSSWQLSPDKLRGLYLYAPKDFVGVMKTTVNLLGPDKRLLDSRAMQLKWISKPQQRPPQPVVASAGNEAPVEVRSNAAGIRSSTAPPVARAVRPIDPGEAALLMQQGREFLNAGDISAARVAFRRLADAGIPDAALAFANTYDPAYLAAHNVVGVLGDRALARTLYQRAKELGSAEAGRILADMGAQ